MLGYQVGVLGKVADVPLRLDCPVVLVDRGRLRIDLACLNRASTEVRQGSVEAANTREIVDEIEHAGKLTRYDRRLVAYALEA